MPKKSDKLDEIKASAQKVWLAGLGALAQAEKRGDKLFKTLIKKGKKFETLVPEANEAMKDSLFAAKKQANQTLSDVEAAFDRQMKRAMKRAGLATKAEVDALRKEVAALKRAAKSGTRSAKKKATKKKATKKKAPAKKKPAKKKS